MKIRDGGDLEIKIIDFLVSGSESIELLFRFLSSLEDWGIYLNDKKRGGGEPEIKAINFLVSGSES